MKQAKAADAAASRYAAEVEAAAKKDKQDKANQIKALEAERAATKKAAQKVEADAKAKKVAAAKAMESRQEEIKKEQEEAKSRRHVKMEAKRVSAAARKAKIAETERKAKESAAAAAKAEEEQKAEEKAARKIAFEMETKKREASANWEDSGKAAVKIQEEKKQKQLAAQQRRVLKTQAVADAKLALARELEKPVKEEEKVEEVVEEAAAAEPEPAPEAAAAEPEAAAAASEEEEGAEEGVDAALSAAEADSAALKVDLEGLGARSEALTGRIDKVAGGGADAPAPAPAAAAAPAKGGVDADKRAEALKAPEEGDVPTPGEKHIIYDDDEAIGKKAPTLGTIEYIQGEPVVMGKGKPVCIVFWAKAYKGDYTTLRDVSKIADLFGDDIQFVGIGIDPSKKDSESFLKKIGTKMPEIYIKQPLQVNFPLAYDTDLELKGAYKATGKMLSLGASAVFLVGGDRTIVWREQFAPATGHTVFKGQLQEQCRRLILGEALVSNGNRPVEEEEEQEEMDMGGGDDDFDW